MNSKIDSLVNDAKNTIDITACLHVSLNPALKMCLIFGLISIVDVILLC